MSTPPDGSPADRTGRRSALTARFLRAVGGQLDDADLTPAAIARAVVVVLPIEAAGLSTLLGDLRMPLGSSDDDAARAEELQTSMGEGPCLDAARLQAPVVLDLAALPVRWPHYSDELMAKTRFRSVAAIPLYAPGRGVFAALDLFTTDEHLSDRLDVTAVEELVGRPAAALLSTCLDELDDVDTPDARPDWYQAAAGRRHDVWVAIGMVMNGRFAAARPAASQDALRLLRAEARSQDRSLDDVAADVVEGRLPPADLGK